MIRIGIIGCGYWGPNLIRNLDRLPDCEIKLICDTNQKRLDDMKSRYPYTDITCHSDDLFDSQEIDAVFICTPVHTHYHLAKKGLENHKHVFIEKPMAESVIQCEELNKIAKDNNVKLMVGHTFLYNPVVRKIKEIIESNELGDIQYIASRRLNLGLFQKDINVAWDLAPHDISIILYLVDENPISVNCQGKAHEVFGIEDVTNITMDFENGCYATIHNSWLDPNKIREMTIVGKKKMLVYDDIVPHEKIKIFDKRVEEPSYYNTWSEFQFAYHYGDTYAPFIQQEEPLYVECSHFIDCIKNDKEPLTSGENGLEVVRILESASNSLLQNGSQISLRNKTKVAVS